MRRAGVPRRADCANRAALLLAHVWLTGLAAPSSCAAARVVEGCGFHMDTREAAGGGAWVIVLGGLRKPAYLMQQFAM